MGIKFCTIYLKMDVCFSRDDQGIVWRLLLYLLYFYLFIYFFIKYVIVENLLNMFHEKAHIVCSVILLPIAITFYITWGFIHFVDGFFSPIYNHLGINIFGKWIYLFCV